MLGLSTTALRKGLADTEDLTKVRQGKNIYLVRAEVETHIDNLIERTKERQARTLAHVYPELKERGRLSVEELKKIARRYK
jgi:hypothetical protein